MIGDRIFKKTITGKKYIYVYCPDIHIFCFIKKIIKGGKKEITN